jgi:hypothetical protein
MVLSISANLKDLNKSVSFVHERIEVKFDLKNRLVIIHESRLLKIFFLIEKKKLE